MTVSLQIDTSGVKQMAQRLPKLESALFDVAMPRIAERVGELAKHSLLKPTSTWSHKPNVRVSIRFSGEGFIVEVVVKDEIYAYVNFGTRPHVIAASRGNVLAFSSNYSPATQPNSLLPLSGGYSGDTRFAAYVRHPGSQPRNFDQEAAKEVAREIGRITREEIQNVVDRFNRGSI